MKVGDLIRSNFQPIFYGSDGQLGARVNIKGKVGLIVGLEPSNRFRVQFSEIQWILSDSAMDVIREY